MYTSLLGWRRYRYLWWSLLLALVASILYTTQSSSAPQPPNGGTWQGYTLGTVGALLIVWLSLLGVRKRRYRSTLGSVEGWTSAHVYLGLALILIATLHCAAQFGWNVHTLAYILMCAVIVSGIFGLYAYLHLPRQMSLNRVGVDRDGWRSELAECENSIRQLTQRCDADVQGLALSALQLTWVANRPMAALFSKDRSRIELPDGRIVKNRGQAVLLSELSTRIPNARRQSEAEALNELLAVCSRRQVILARLNRDARLQTVVRCWLWLHIPLTAGLLTALVVHILSVFLYW